MDIGVLLVLNIVTSDQRHYVDRDWLKGYLTFSFQDYYDEENNDFGNLLVFNEEVLSPAKGFNMHPTHYMEVITYVLDGELVHFDNVSNETTHVSAGEFQILHAGDGIEHSEKNASKEYPLKFLQFWFSPNNYENKAGYDKLSVDKEKAANCLYKIFGKDDGLCHIRQDVSFYLSVLDSGKSLEYNPSECRKTFVFLLDGKLDINRHILNSKDSARTKDSERLLIKALEKSEFFLIDIN